MTAPLKKPGNFQELLKSNLGRVSKKEAIILDKSFSPDSEKGILREVEMVRCLRPNLNKFFYSICIDFSQKNNLTHDFLKQVCFEYLQLNGLFSINILGTMTLSILVSIFW